MSISSGSLALGLVVGALAGAVGFGVYAGAGPGVEERLSYLEAQIQVIADGQALASTVAGQNSEAAARALRGNAQCKPEGADEIRAKMLMAQSIGMAAMANTVASDMNQPSESEATSGGVDVQFNASGQEVDARDARAEQALAELLGNTTMAADAHEGDVQSLDDLIVKKVSQKWTRPKSARNGQRVEVQIAMAADGTITSAEVVSSSGDSAFDASALVAVRSVKRIPEIGQLDRRTYAKLYSIRRVVFSPEDLPQ